MTRFCVLLCSLLMTLSLGAQVILNTTLPVACTTISAGEPLSFLNETGSGCSGAFGVTSDGVTFTELTDLGSGLYEFTFDAPGSYEIYCNLPPFDLDLMARSGSLAACVEVVDGVPTLGEWGLISLAFLLMIFSVVAIRNTSKQEALDIA